jgi:hypothetical protein
MAITLKDGTVTQDKRLDRIVEFDERSRAYPIRALVAPVVKPRGYTWATPPSLDQGQDGACVGFAFTQDILARPVPLSTVDATFAKEHVYWEAQKLDSWPGGEYPDADPRYSGTSTLAGAKVLQSLGFFKEYRWAFGLDDLILAVGYKGPAIVGINWYGSMFTPDTDGVVHVTGDVAGGHDILVVGVNVKKKLFKLHNSWGPNWGIEGGSCYISFDDMGRLLSEDGDACIPVNRTKPKGF